MNTIQTTCVASLLALGTASTLTSCSIESPPALTIAMTATSNEPAPSTAALTEMLIEHAERALDPGDAEVTVVTPDSMFMFDLTPMRGDEVEAGNGRDRKIAANITAFDEQLSTIRSAASQLDLISVIDTGLENTDPGGRVMVLTSGFSTSDPTDLNAAGDWTGAPEKFVERIDQKNLPDATGKHLTFLGLGYPDPGSAQATAGPAARSALHTITLGLCTRMNAASCEVLPGPVSTLPSNSTTPAPVVELDRLTTRCVGQVDIDTSIAFGPESAVLLPDADAQLMPVVQSLMECPASTVVDAVGHSAAVPHPSWGGGPELEQRRAQAILDRLVVLGAPQSVIGSASAGGQLIDNMPGGHFREELAARNRTVMLDITA
ncbi:hypothetical protein D1O33_24435 (plasmid) [Rhodococcus rhodochrous]|uniref:hypothetical protein n=1 Tax=Rhodococcus rhodochrous TaxID=1829 RepID=UPI00132E8FCB|nr:hypothetical protein [Rhodococcus rhodochrous]QHG85233.1 hypothetical protein D1O33_24435 [Rhodococcus rhodochrous]